MPFSRPSFESCIPVFGSGHHWREREETSSDNLCLETRTEEKYRNDCKDNKEQSINPIDYRVKSFESKREVMLRALWLFFIQLLFFLPSLPSLYLHTSLSLSSTWRFKVFILFFPLIFFLDLLHHPRFTSISFSFRLQRNWFGRCIMVFTSTFIITDIFEGSLFRMSLKLPLKLCYWQHKV